MIYFVATIVSPAGFRETLATYAPNADYAKNVFLTQMVGFYPQWKLHAVRKA